MHVMTQTHQDGFRFLTSITNTTIADKITRSKHLPQKSATMLQKGIKARSKLTTVRGS